MIPRSPTARQARQLGIDGRHACAAVHGMFPLPAALDAADALFYSGRDAAVEQLGPLALAWFGLGWDFAEAEYRHRHPSPRQPQLPGGAS